jgi:hypothetical protein
MLPLFLAQEQLHDIAPPVDYSLLPPWVVFLASFVALAILGLLVWLIIRWSKKPQPEISARTRAMQELQQARQEIASRTPYEFSIRVSDILRRYVMEQSRLPMTRQTSVEFLEAAAREPSFTREDKELLGDFLSRCDLIKFARYEATQADSELLLQEATRFVEGGKLEPAA